MPLKFVPLNEPISRDEFLARALGKPPDEPLRFITRIVVAEPPSGAMNKFGSFATLHNIVDQMDKASGRRI